MANPNPQSGFNKNPQNINRDGRPPKGYSITEMFQQMFKENPERKIALGETIYRKAIKGDPTAIKLVWNYLDGMPSQNLNIGGQEGNQLKITIEDYGAKDNPATETKSSPGKK